MASRAKGADLEDGVHWESTHHSLKEEFCASDFGLKPSEVWKNVLLLRLRRGLSTYKMPTNR